MFLFFFIGGNQKKELKTQDTLTISPKHRQSFGTSASMSVEVLHDGDSDRTGTILQPMLSIQHQHSLDQTTSIAIKQPDATVAIDVQEICAESLEKILDNKAVREKRLEMEKKLESLRKKHDKEKVKVAAQKGNSLDGTKKPKFSMTNKLVKRLSSKNL